MNTMPDCSKILSLGSLHRLSKKILNLLFNSHNMMRKKRRKLGNLTCSDSRSPSPCFSAMEISTQLKQVFKFIDVNGDGKISPAELCEALLNIGEKKSIAAAGEEEEAIGIIFRQVDRNGDGSIDLEEFMTAVAAAKSEEEEEMILDAFVVFDQDEDGYISAGELKKVLERLGFEGCGIRECKKMIRNVDKDGDGFVDFHEFKSMMSTATTTITTSLV